MTAKTKGRQFNVSVIREANQTADSEIFCVIQAQKLSTRHQKHSKREALEGFWYRLSGIAYDQAVRLKPKC